MSHFWNGFEKRAWKETSIEQKKIMMTLRPHMEKLYRSDERKNKEEYEKNYKRFHDKVNEISKKTGLHPAHIMDYADSYDYPQRMLERK